MVPSKSEKWIRYALIVLAGALAILLVFVFFQYQALRRAQLLGAWRLRASIFLEHHAPLPVDNADAIHAWMTFDYINKLFALPPNYLEMQLGISASSSYPHLTISGYAKTQNMSSTIFLSEVQDAVLGYASSSASTSPSASHANAL